MNKRSGWPLGKLALALLGSAALHGCGGGTLNSEKNHGSLRLLNATSEYGTLDLVNGSTGIASAVASYAASSYAEVDPSTPTLALRSPGSGANAATATVTVVKGGHTALIAYTTGGTLAVLPLGEDDSAPSSGFARLRFVNTASVEAGAVDVYVLTASTPCSALPSAISAAATGVSTSLGSPVDNTAAAGGTAYNLCVYAAGDKTDLRLDMPGITLSSQQVATLVLAKAKDGVLVNGLLLSQQGSLTVKRNASARVRVVAALPAGGSVTVSGGGATLASGLVSPNVGSYRLVTAGDLGLTVNGAAITRSVDAGADLSLLVTGTTGASVFSIDDDNTPSTSSTRPVRIRLVNGIAGSAGLTVDNEQAAENVSFGAASTPYYTVPASSATAVLAVTSAGTALPSLTAQTLTAGRVYSVFLLPRADGQPDLRLRPDR